MNESNPRAAVTARQKVVLLLAWLVVGLPLLWGVGQTMGKAAALFQRT